jgi:hypothetical protein
MTLMRIYERRSNGFGDTKDAPRLTSPHGALGIPPRFTFC